ncbi:MAG: DNA polymerase III subunit gamma/tau [Candidatus Marinimicrobia bacterium]|nr:DNA polymerase III subunit gamma/tau [Candidatus Neomarinimicrobiota bacterium]
MSHQVISLKYRPQRFEDVVGQEHITVTLQNALKKKRLGHAYIFSGPRGTGKTTTARLLAKLVNCEDPKDGNPCNACVSCREITEGRSMDVHEIDGASNRGIDSIRDLREQVKYPPTRGKYKVYIIDEFHQITKEAFNALLKTLEEPPKHILFIFATTELHKVLPTILSRCQRFEFRRIPIPRVMQLLREIADREGAAIDDDALMLIAKKGDGSIRDSESILEQVIAFSGEAVSYESILNMLGVIREEVFFDLYRALNEGSAGCALALLDDMLMRGYDAAEFVTHFSIFLRDLYIVRVHGSAELLNTSETLRKEYETLARNQDDHTIVRMLVIVNDHLPEIGRSANVKILCESLFIKLSRLQDFRDLDAVLARLNGEKTAVPLKPKSETPKAEIPKTVPVPGAVKAAPVQKVPASAESEHPAAVSVEEVKKRWQEVVDCVQPKKPALAGLLCRVGLMQSNGGILVLTVEDDYSYDFLQRNDATIRSCLKSVFKSSFNLRVEKNPVPDSDRVMKERKVDGAVQQVIQSFEGELL